MTITANKLRELGIENVAKFAGCINANYLMYMNGGSNGYTIKQLKTIKSKYSKYVTDNFEAYIKGVEKSYNTVASTKTEKYLKKAFQEWYS